MRARMMVSPVSRFASTLIATSRPSLVSRARYTSPMPPEPMSETISYAPMRVPRSMAIASGQQSPGQDGPHGVRQPTAIVPRDFGAPELSNHRFDAVVEIAQRQRMFVFGGVSLARLRRAFAVV